MPIFKTAALILFAKWVFELPVGTIGYGEIATPIVINLVIFFGYDYWKDWLMNKKIDQYKKMLKEKGISEDQYIVRRNGEVNDD